MKSTKSVAKATKATTTTTTPKRRTKKDIYMETLKLLTHLYSELIEEGYLYEADTILNSMNDLLDDVKYED